MTQEGYTWHAGQRFAHPNPPASPERRDSRALVKDSSWADVVTRPRTLRGLVNALDTWALRGQMSIFRGQSRYYSLTPSIARGDREVSDLPRLEMALASDFRLSARPLLKEHEVEQSKTILGTLALLQHHGGVTGLLDWSESVWVAAYFACSGSPDETGYVWCYQTLDFGLLVQQPQDLMEQLWLGEDETEWMSECRTKHEWFLSFRPSIANGRMQAQQAMFTLANPLHVPHCEIIAEHSESKSMQLIAIPSHLKRPMLMYLSSMNISAATLFPGLDGTCQRFGVNALYRLR